ncbi:hypothetical protein [Reyranella sp.]|uniref:hypothetical protein n=1 Tax=Reyranella sp. TaxID=1929291 RepID=UPI001212BE93|nr:hypothetical protein [Reyranella sp.]TAJ82889.1 MAG: hypothetical protein EPO50_24625 [Reyranella sp.]
MDFHLERGLRLHTEPQYKNLYKWAINEVNAEGRPIGGDQIPWRWSLDFTATSCVLRDSFQIRQPLGFSFTTSNSDGTTSQQETGGQEDRSERSQVIRLELRPGSPRDTDGYDRQTKFSMFGTDRTIQKFELCITSLASNDEQERCTVWGCPSYTTEIDFRDETTDDCIVFSLSVKPEAFTRYIEKIDRGLVDDVHFSVGHVDGFYSEWSPSISTSRVKVLTSDQEHKVTLPTDREFEVPRLGRIGEVSLSINRHLELVDNPPHAHAVEPKTEVGAGIELRAPQATTNLQALTDSPMMHVLQSLKRAAWLSAWALGLLLVVILLRR